MASQTAEAGGDFGAFVSGPRRVVDGASEGPLAGLAFAVKDLIDIAGTTTGGGNLDWRRSHAPAARNAPVVATLLAAGARLVGKTITDELAFSLEGANAHDGTPVNPRCPDRLPGGSSSGSAVAAAAGLVDFALGTDTGGSVRVPASFCGVFGFRPSHGVAPLDGVVPFAPSYDTVGWLAGDGSVLERVGRALLGGGGAAPPRRWLLARDAFDLCDPPCAAALLAAARALGASREVTLFAGEEALWLEAYRVLQGAEIWSSLGPWITATQPRFGDAIAERFADASRITPDLVGRFAPIRRRIAAGLEALLAPGTALLLPTAPCIAPRKDAPAAEIGEFYRRALTLTSGAGHAGLPQLSLPLAEAEGCPLGLSILGPRGSDASLLAVAARSQPARR
ncbi:MAG: amidase [Stellaceae bacterium]